MPEKRVEAVPHQVLNVRLPVNVSTEAPTRKYRHQPHGSMKLPMANKLPSESATRPFK
jgi:hypothetical protein